LRAQGHGRNYMRYRARSHPYLEGKVPPGGGKLALGRTSVQHDQEGEAIKMDCGWRKRPAKLTSPMKKTFQLNIEGKHRDRVLDAVKHEIRKYVKRERRRDLPEGVDFLDFDCRFGATPDTAAAAHLTALNGLIDTLAKDGGDQFYVEILAKPGHRQARPATVAGEGDVPSAD